MHAKRQRCLLNPAHKTDLQIHSVRITERKTDINCPILYAFFQQILTDIQNFFTVTIRTKCLITLSLKVLSHLKCVATLPYVGK